MKRIEFPTFAAIGNSPIFANTGDINFMGSQADELANLIGKLLATDQELINVRIAGAKWSTNVLGSGDTEYTVTDGWIWANGELFTITGTTVTVPSGSTNIPLWTLSETYPTGSGHDVNIGGTINTFNVRIIRGLLPVIGPAGGSGVSDYVCDYNEVFESALSGEWNYIDSTTLMTYLDFENFVSPTFSTQSPPNNAARTNYLAWRKVGNNVDIIIRTRVLWSSNPGHTCGYCHVTLPFGWEATPHFPLCGIATIFNSVDNAFIPAQYKLRDENNVIEITFDSFSVNTSGTVELYFPLTSIHLA